MPEPASDWIHLRAFAFPCVVGLYEWERQAPQPLGVEASLNLDLGPAAGGDLGATVDYARALEDLQFLAQRGGWHLLESLAAALAAHLLAPPEPGEPRAQVDAVRLRLSKPDVFGGRALPTVEIHRTATPALRPYQPLAGVPGVSVAVLQVTPASGAYRIRLDPGATWSVPEALALRLLTGSPHLNGVSLALGALLEPGTGVLNNPEAGPSCLLAAGRPLPASHP